VVEKGLLVIAVSGSQIPQTLSGPGEELLAFQRRPRLMGFYKLVHLEGAGVALRIKSQEEIEGKKQIMSEAKKCSPRRPPRKRRPN